MLLFNWIDTDIPAKGMESRIALLPSDMRSFDSIPMDSDNDIIRAASHV